MEFTEEELKIYIGKHFPDKVLVDLKMVENEAHDQYEMLWKSVSMENEDLRGELNSVANENEHLKMEVQKLRAELDDFEKIKGTALGKSAEVADYVMEIFNTGITVGEWKIESKSNEGGDKNIKGSLDDLEISSHPGIYGGESPGHFLTIAGGKMELTRENLAGKVSRNAFLEVGFLLKKLMTHDKKTKDEDVAEARRQRITELLSTRMDNEEKYLRYIVISPGISQEFCKILERAGEMGLDADLMIRLLEQPVERFNKEIIERFVSRGSKGLGYDFRQAVVRELLDEDCVVMAEIYGTPCKMKLVPMEQLVALRDEVERLCKTIEGGIGKNESYEERDSGVTAEDLMT